MPEEKFVTYIDSSGSAMSLLASSVCHRPADPPRLVRIVPSDGAPPILVPEDNLVLER